MPLCKTCMTLPEQAPRETTILVAVPTIATEESLYAWSDENAFRWDTLGSGLVSIELHGDGLDRLTEWLAATMSSPELAESRVLLYNEGAEFRPLDLLRTDTAEAFIAKIRSEWLGDLLREGGLNTVFQPIFAMATGEVSAHECLMRASHQGRPLFPGEIIGAARATGLLFHLDRAARIAAIENAAARGVTTDIFVNFNPTSIYNPAACLQTTVRAAENAGIARERIVFEVVESDDVEDRD
ncbi:EAL domain-containing protein, partial [bacterium]